MAMTATIVTSHPTDFEMDHILLAGCAVLIHPSMATPRLQRVQSQYGIAVVALCAWSVIDER
jgi:hypothetical protein